MAKYLSNIDLNKNQLQNPVIHSLGTAPATPVEGQIYFDSTTGDKHIYLYNGTAWVQLSEGAHTSDSYVSNVSLSGTDLTFTGVGSAFNGSVDLSSLDEIVNDSTITIDAGTYLSTGGSFTLNQASNATITIDHDDTSRSDTTSTDAPSYGGTFEAVTSVTTNTTGHVTGINVSTVTLPTSDDTTYDLTGGVSNVTDFAISLSGSDASLDKVFLKASNYITLTDGGSNDVIITHSDTNRTDTTSTDAPGYGGTFEAVQSVTTNAQGHVTAIDVSTVTIPASDDTTYDLTGSIDGGNGKIVLTGSDSSQDIVTLEAGTNITLSSTGANSITIDAANPDQTVTLTGDVTGTGTTSIATTISAGAVDFAMLNSTDVITAAEGIENNDNDVTIPTSAAVKAYADSLIVGGLIYQGGYNAATNTPDLTTSPNSIEKGWTYTVTADGTFFGEQLRVGDVLIAEVNDPSALADWTTVQNNIDLASLTQVGIGNVNAGDAIDVSYSSGTATISAEDSTASNKGVIIVSKETNAEHRGVYVNYDAPGEVNIGLDIDTIPEDATPPMDESVMVYHDEQTGENYSIQISDLLALASGQTSVATTITDTATITHNLGTKDVIIQLYDVTTDETVYADVDRISTTQATITFASTPTNSIRVLVQKIG